MPPTTRRINAIRNRINAHFLTETCILQEAVKTPTPTGNRKDTWQSVATDVACRVIYAQSDFSREMMEKIGDQIAMTEMYNLIVPHDQILKEGYRVIVNEKIYSIVALSTELTDKGYRQAIITREVDA